MSNARTRLAEAIAEPRLLAHYFRQDPRLAFRAFVAGPTMQALVCSWRGHDLSGTWRLLHLCNRCGVEYPEPSTTVEASTT